VILQPHISSTAALLSVALIATARAQWEAGRTSEANSPRHQAWYFADEERFEHVFAADADAPQNSRIRWTLRVGDRVLESGTQHVSPRLGFKIGFRPFDVRPGVVLATDLTAVANGGGHTSTFDVQLNLVSHTFSAGQRQLFETVGLTLFDKQGSLADAFDEQDIAYQRLRRLADIDAVSEGLLLVPEGASFRLQPQLADTLLRAAQRGVFVICFAPKEGSFPFPDVANGDLTAATAIQFAGSDYLTKLDKRLDASASAPCLSLAAPNGDVSVLFDGNAHQWHALNLDFARLPTPPHRAPGRFLVLGLNMATLWNSNPTARYTLMALAQERLDALASQERPRQ
jgi:hypothetical protein